MIRSKKIFIHDYFENLGGGEKLILKIIEKNDILVTSFIKPEIKRFLKLNKIICMQKYSRNIFFNKFFLPIYFIFYNFEKKYRNCLVSGNYSIFTNLNKFKNKIFYCHSLPKLFFNFNKFYRNKSFIVKIFIFFIRKFFKYFYIKNLSKFDSIISNSKFTKKELDKVTKKKVKVVYPPIKSYLSKKIRKKKFFLSNSRHEIEKNIDIIIDVFNNCKNKELIILSKGSQTKILKKNVKNKNIKFLGIVDERKYKLLLNQCVATINISSNEDFGMSAIEGMSAGKPAIVINEGGYLETCKNNFNSFILNKKNIKFNLLNLIKNFNYKKANQMKQNCIKTANYFSEKRFLKEVKSLFV